MTGRARTSAALLAVLALALAGCGAGNNNAAGTTSTTSAAQSQANSSCTKADLSLTIGDQTAVAQSAQQFTQNLVFQNTSTAPCYLDGFPNVDVIGIKNGAVYTYSEPHRTGTASKVTLQPGKSAQSTLTYLASSSDDPTDCDNGHPWTPSTIIVTAPNDTESFTSAWTGGSFDDCQAAATHPGDYVSPVTLVQTP